jgi:hypothetical protein
MGYTHYWYYQPNGDAAEQEAFAQAAHRILAYANFLESQGTIIRGPLGVGGAEITPSSVRFNGDRATGHDHETFSVEFGEVLPRQGFNFCKTARKPYDTLVCLSLLAFYDELGPDTFHYVSDGGNQEWDKAYHIYETFHSHPAPRFPQS